MLVVQKFGGTSLATIDRIKTSCSIIKKYVLEGKKVVVVVSAMSGETDRLLSLYSQIDYENKMELDVILSTGEQVSAGLIACTLNSIGVKARSYCAWQIGLITNGDYSNAKIENVYTSEMIDALTSGVTPVVTGFQGYFPAEKRQTTLGRGGSDTSAIAIAAALKADKCEIYTDVDGVFSIDPNLDPKAKKLETIEYEKMIELSNGGAKIMEVRSMHFANKYNVNTEVISSFAPQQGTLITNNRSINESPLITSVSSNVKEAYIQVANASLEDVLNTLKAKNVTFSYLSHFSDVASFTILKTDCAKIESMRNITINKKIAIIAIVGSFMKNNFIFQKALNELNANKVKIFASLMSETKISFIVEESMARASNLILHSLLIS
jgi:aspartate kinase